MSRAAGILARFGLAACAALGSAARADELAPLDLHALAVEAYRAEDWEGAHTLWSRALAAPGAAAPTLDRAVLLYDLGNAAYRLDRKLEAVARYTAALRLAPRFADARANLELARAELELEPADRGDLESALERAIDWTAPREAEWLALGGFVLAALGLGFEALRGGPRARNAALVAVALGALLAAPWLGQLATRAREPWMIVAAGGAPLHSEPRDGAAVQGALAAGLAVEARDTFPGWISVASGDQRGWIRAEHALPLEPRDSAFLPRGGGGTLGP